MARSSPVMAGSNWVLSGSNRVLAGYGWVLAGIVGSARYASTSLSDVTWLFEIIFAPIPNTEFVLGRCCMLLHNLEVPKVVIIGVLSLIQQNMIGMKVGWSQGDIVMIGIIETVQNRTSSGKRLQRL
ncbi:hypothetical protein Tco_0736846 [Tanacetum coccineum]